MKSVLPRFSTGLRWRWLRGAAVPPPQPARTTTAASAAALAGARTLEDHEDRELFVRREAVVGARIDEHGVPLRDRHGLALDLEDAAALEHDVHLVVLVRLLAVRLRRDEDVDAELDARRLVDDLVAAAGRAEPLDRTPHTEGMHGSDVTGLANTNGALEGRRSRWMRRTFQPVCLDRRGRAAAGHRRLLARALRPSHSGSPATRTSGGAPLPVPRRGCGRRPRHSGRAARAPG